MKKTIIFLVMWLVSMTAVPSFAAQLRVFVADMHATGVQNGDELQMTLQTLLASRLNNDKILVMGSAPEADIIVSGSYVTIGKMFSIDSVAKTAAGKTVARAFVQGETQDELIPAVGKLAEKMSAELVKIYPAGLAVATPFTPAAVTTTSDLVKHESQVSPAPAEEFIRPRELETTTKSGWLSKRLVGADNIMAVGKILPDGRREIFMAEDSRVSYYRQGSSMTLVSEKEISNGKIISLDIIEESDATVSLYVTIVRVGELVSQVWQVKGDKMAVVAENLPYYFRSASLGGGPKKLYAQAMGREEDFYGDVAEATRTGAEVILKNPIKLPRYGTIYNFNQLHDQDGKTLTIIINPDGYLIVFDQSQKELWRSNDKYGGSELYFQKDDIENARTTGSIYRWVFLNQPIQISSKGEVLVGKNGGFWVLGNARSYKNGAVYCMIWNGSSLEEKWRTRDTQNYMPDFFFDEAHNELLILQTVQRRGITGRGASTLSIKKIE